MGGQKVTYHCLACDHAAEPHLMSMWDTVAEKQYTQAVYVCKNVDCPRYELFARVAQQQVGTFDASN